MTELKRVYRWKFPRVTNGVLRIPGTHGTWPKKVNWRFERTGVYVVVTRPTWQWTFGVRWGTVMFKEVKTYGRAKF